MEWATTGGCKAARGKGGALWADGGQRAGQGAGGRGGEDVLKVCADIAPRSTTVPSVRASELEASESRNQRHFLCDAVVQAADGRGHVGAVPAAARAVLGEDAVGSLARGALVALEGLRGGKDKGRGWGGGVEYGVLW